MSSHVVLIFRYLSGSHFISMLKTSVSTTHQLVRLGLWSNMKRLIEIGLVLLANRSKICQKVEESSKSLKGLKDLKNLQRPSVRRNVYQSTDPPSIENEELGLPLQLSDSFSSSFC